MKKVPVALVLLFFVPILAGCVSSVDDIEIDRDSRIDVVTEGLDQGTLPLQPVDKVQFGPVVKDIGN